MIVGLTQIVLTFSLNVIVLSALCILKNPLWLLLRIMKLVIARADIISSIIMYIEFITASDRLVLVSSRVNVTLIALFKKWIMIPGIREFVFTVT